MKVEEIVSQVQSIWNYINGDYQIDSPEEVKLRLATLSSYFAWVNEMKPKAKRRYRDSCKEGLMNLAEQASELGLAKSLQTALIDTVNGEKKQLVDELESLDRAISKDMAACTSILSYAKVEMDLMRHQQG